MGPAREPERISCVAVGALAALLAGCASGVTGTPAPSTVSSTPTTISSGPAAAHACTVETDGKSVRSRGAQVRVSGSVVMFACGGPLLTLAGITTTAVTLELPGASVTIAAGSSGTVGPYQVSVLGISRGTAQLQITTA